MSRAGVSKVKTKGEKEASRPRGSREWGHLLIWVLGCGLSQNHLDQPLGEKMWIPDPPHIQPFAALTAGRRLQLSERVDF